GAGSLLRHAGGATYDLVESATYRTISKEVDNGASFSSVLYDDDYSFGGLISDDVYSTVWSEDLVGPLIGRSGYKNSQEFNYAFFLQYQKYTDRAYERALRLESKGLLEIPMGVPR